MLLGSKFIEVTVNGRVLIMGSKPFIVVGTKVCKDGELLDVRHYGPPENGYRRFEFVSKHALLHVKCAKDCEWHYVDLHADRDTDPVDPVPVEVPLRLRSGPTMAQQVRQELLAADHYRREAKGKSDGFLPDEDEDPEELTDYEVTELLIDEALEVSGGTDDTEVRSETAPADGDGDGEKGSGKDVDVPEGGPTQEKGKDAGPGVKSDPALG